MTGCNNDEDVNDTICHQACMGNTSYHQHNMGRHSHSIYHQLSQCRSRQGTAIHHRLHSFDHHTLQAAQPIVKSHFQSAMHMTMLSFASNVQPDSTIAVVLGLLLNHFDADETLLHKNSVTPQEFRQVLLPPRPVSSLPTHKYHKFRVTSDREAPDSFDWRDKGVVSNVKNQGSARSCWAFSTVGNVEGQWALKTGNVTSLSAEQLVECDDQNCGAYGGWPYLAYSYIEKVGGISSENVYPYCVGDKKCFPCMPDGIWCRSHPHHYCNQSQSCSKKLDTNNFVPGLKVKLG